MPISIFAIVLTSALLHALWNLAIKNEENKFRAAVRVALGGGIIALAFVPFIAVPAAEAWPYLAVSALLQAAYYHVVAYLYRTGEFSVAYPIMRGCSPLIVSIAMLAFANENLGVSGYFGVALISTGVIVIGLSGARIQGHWRAVAEAIAAACLVALCTTVDGIGVRLSGDAISYVVWVYVGIGASLFCSLMAVNRSSLRFARGDFALAMKGGWCTLGSYGLCLWALTLAPIAMVSAVRETSILFAAALSWLVLGEALSRKRIFGAILIASGAAILKLA